MYHAQNYDPAKIYGPNTPKSDPQVFWKLSRCEDRLRRRWKLERNYNGSRYKEASAWNNQHSSHNVEIPESKDGPIASETRQLSLLEDFEKAIRRSGPVRSTLETDVASAAEHDAIDVQSDNLARPSDNRAEPEQETSLGSNEYLLSVACELITPMMKTPGKLYVYKQSIQVPSGVYACLAI